MFFIDFPILCYPHSTTRHHKYLVYQTICQSKTKRFSIKLYADHNTLWVKHATHQKAESLRGASLWKLDNAVSKNSIFNTKYAEFSAKCKVLLHFHNSTCAYNHPYNLHQKFVPLLPSIFNPLFHPYLLIKLSSQFILELPSCIPQQFFTTLFLRTTIQKSTPKTFSLPQCFSQLRLRQRTRELAYLVRIDTVSISPFFLKV